MKPISTDSSIDRAELGKWIGAAAAGALLMYVLDPERGHARRRYAVHAVRDAGLQAGDAIGGAIGGALREAGARLSSARDGAANAFAHADAATSRAGYRVAEAAHKTRDDAADTARDARARAGASAQRNTWEGRDRLDEETDRMRAPAPHSGARSWLDELAQAFDSRSPTLTNSALLGSGVLGLTGLARRSPLAVILGLGAIALLAKNGGADRLTGLLRGKTMGSRIEIEKSIHIEASPEEVYDAWSNYDNFPRFMSHVSEVHDIGHRRSHWVVKGPGGAEYSWNAIMTEQTRPDHMAWRSEPGAEIEQEGSVSFEPARGGTRVTVRLTYTPPGGVLGHGLARLLGTDPKRQMDDDLGRMKSFIERGATPHSTHDAPARDRYLH